MSQPHVLAQAFTLATGDGQRLFLRRWSPPARGARAPLGRIVLVHGFMEHAGRYHDFACALASAGLEVVGPDLRGHGLSEGPRGHVDQFADYRADVAQVLAAHGHLARVPTFLLGHSLGGLIALDVALAGEQQLDGLIVTNPFIAAAMPVALHKRLLAQLMQRLWPTLALPTGIDRTGMTHDVAVRHAAAKDPLIFDRASAGWWGQVVAAQQRVRRGGPLQLPVLAIFGGADPIASPAAGRACLARVDASDRTVWERPDELHEVLNERLRWSLWADIIAWALPRALARAQAH